MQASRSFIAGCFVDGFSAIGSSPVGCATVVTGNLDSDAGGVPPGV